jgi:hypothetical protein
MWTVEGLEIILNETFLLTASWMKGIIDPQIGRDRGKA